MSRLFRGALALAFVLRKASAQLVCGQHASYLQSGACACDYGYTATNTSDCVAAAANACIQYAAATSVAGYVGSYVISIGNGAKASTTATLQVGATYTVTFLAASAGASIIVAAGNANLSAISVDRGTSLLYPYETASFVASSSSTNISMWNNGSATAWIDYVRFEPMSQVTPQLAPPVVAKPSPPPYAAPPAAPPPYAGSTVSSRGTVILTAAGSIDASLAIDGGIPTMVMLSYGSSMLFRSEPPGANVYGTPIVTIAVFDTVATGAASSSYILSGTLDSQFCGVYSPSAQIVVLGNQNSLDIAYASLSYSSAVRYFTPSADLNALLETSVLSSSDPRRSAFGNVTLDGYGGSFVQYTYSDITYDGLYVRVCSVSAMAPSYSTYGFTKARHSPD